jgi:hypothetical protein
MMVEFFEQYFFVHGTVVYTDSMSVVVTVVTGGVTVFDFVWMGVELVEHLLVSFLPAR